MAARSTALLQYSLKNSSAADESGFLMSSDAPLLETHTLRFAAHGQANGTVPAPSHMAREPDFLNDSGIRVCSLRYSMQRELNCEYDLNTAYVVHNPL